MSIMAVKSFIGLAPAGFMTCSVFKNAQTNSPTAVSCAHQMFMRLTPGISSIVPTYNKNTNLAAAKLKRWFLVIKKGLLLCKAEHSEAYIFCTDVLTTKKQKLHHFLIYNSNTLLLELITNS
jgi:hypothetical protein